MEQHTLKIVNNCLNTYIYSYFETSGGQSFNLNLNVVNFFSPVLNRHLWQLKTVIFLHWCLLHAVMLEEQVLVTGAKQSKCTKTKQAGFTDL
jgi:hypothetical protein